jgi:hypothetical protein
MRISPKGRAPSVAFLMINLFWSVAALADGLDAVVYTRPSGWLGTFDWPILIAAFVIAAVVAGFFVLGLMNQGRRGQRLVPHR